MPAKTVVYADKAVLARATAARTILALGDALASKEEVHLALAGGFVAREVLSAIAVSKLSNDVDWSGLHVWWVDERFVAPASSDRNDKEALENLARVWDKATFHPMGNSEDFDSASQAAKDYTEQLASFNITGFDLALLGMGPDGLVASLFPGRELSSAPGFAVRNSPKPPATRVSLSMQLLVNSSLRFVVLAGEEKSAAFAKAIAAGMDQKQIPAAALNTSGTYWLTDLAAAGN